MPTISNLTAIASATSQTLRSGSALERILLGTALIGIALLIAQKIYNLIARFFTNPQERSSLSPVRPNTEALDDYAKRLQAQFSQPPPSAPPPPVQPASQQEVRTRPLMSELSIHDQPLEEAAAIELAAALHACQGLKTEIEEEEGRFDFLVRHYLQEGKLPEKLVRVEKNQELTIPEHFNPKFAHVQQQLVRAKLSLAHLKRSSQPIAHVQFRNGSSKDIYTLSELHETLKLQAPHIVSRFEIELSKEKIEKVKRQLHQSRMQIIGRGLSIIRPFLIDDLVEHFPARHPQLNTLFKDPAALRFVAENLCWHVLDRLFETIELTFIPTKEKQTQRITDLESKLLKVVSDPQKRQQAQAYLVQAFANPHAEDSIQSLVDLLIAETGNLSEREDLIKKVQQPELDVQEGNVLQELGRLEALQKFYNAFIIALAVADEGKRVLIEAKDQEEKPQKIHVKVILHPSLALSRSIRSDTESHDRQLNRVGRTTVAAGQRAVQAVVKQRWDASLAGLDEELKVISGDHSQLIEEGWVKFEDKSLFFAMNGHQRWLITQKMILQKVDRAVLHQKGDEVAQEVGKWISSFVKNLYGRLVTVILHFDKQTKLAQKDPKPADRIAKAFMDSLLQSYRALVQVKKDTGQVAGEREELIVKVLERNGEMHPSASHKRGADAVFLGKLILEFLSVLQPEGLSNEIQTLLMSAFNQQGTIEPTLIQKAIETYNTTIRPAAEPVVKSVGPLVLKVLEYIVEKKSAHNFASQLSEVLDPININAGLADLLMQDTSTIEVTPPNGTAPIPAKWYPDDESALKQLLQERAQQSAQVGVIEKSMEELKQKKQPVPRELTQEWIVQKTALARTHQLLVPLLLRRIIISKVPKGAVGYAVQLAEDFHELIQYPRILRHIIFHVLEKATQSLAKPLDEKEAMELLESQIEKTAPDSAFNFLLSDLFKNDFGSSLLSLLWSTTTTETSWKSWGFRTLKTVAQALPGTFVFSQLQALIEDLIVKKFEDPEAINWSGTKLVATMNAKIVDFAEDPSDKGMSALIAEELRKIFAEKKD